MRSLFISRGFLCLIRLPCERKIFPEICSLHGSDVDWLLVVPFVFLLFRSIAMRIRQYVWYLFVEQHVHFVILTEKQKITTRESFLCLVNNHFQLSSRLVIVLDKWIFIWYETADRINYVLLAFFSFAVRSLSVCIDLRERQQQRQRMIILVLSCMKNRSRSNLRARKSDGDPLLRNKSFVSHEYFFFVCMHIIRCFRFYWSISMWRSNQRSPLARPIKCDINLFFA